jgi:hypothetical protein
MIGDLEEARKAYFAAGGIPSDIPDRGINWYQRRTVKLLQRRIEKLQVESRVETNRLIECIHDVAIARDNALAEVARLGNLVCDAAEKLSEAANARDHAHGTLRQMERLMLAGVNEGAFDLMHERHPRLFEDDNE